MNRSSLLLLASVCLVPLGMRALEPLDIVLITSEADSVVAVARRVEQGKPAAEGDFAHIFATDGFRHLQERESAMGAPIGKAEFAAFVDSLGRSGSASAYAAALSRLEAANLSRSVRLANAYLPAGTRIRARLYLEIKPLRNSFVFKGSDSLPSIFLAVQPTTTPAQATNKLAHELHHIGTALACRGIEPHGDSTRIGGAKATLLEYLTAFGEGRAMLAAAGGPDIHPHAADDDSIRKRWDRDVAHADADIAELSSFADDVLAGRITTADSVRSRADSYYGVQGPWYTVGWLMASTIERQLGRPALIATLCDPVAFLTSYNHAARRIPAAKRPPVWPDSLLERLAALERS